MQTVRKYSANGSNGFQFSVTATTPDAPVITDVKVSGSTIKVTYRPAANATGYDVVLGTSSKKDNGELRPYNYGAHKKLNLKEGTVTATFKKVPKEHGQLECTHSTEHPLITRKYLAHGPILKQLK